MIKKYLFSILLFLFVIIVAYSQTDKSETIPRDKVILNVNAVVNATVKHEKEETKINENLNLQLTQTVEYEIVRNNGEEKNIRLEMLSQKNRMTANGKGSIVSYVEGIGVNRDDYTYSIDPEVSYRQARIAQITVGKPYKIQIDISDFYRDCNGSASGTSRNISGWEGDGPTYETLPIKKEQFYVSTAVRGIFESPEDMELSMKGEKTALQQKLQGAFTPREDGGFLTSGKVSHSYNYKDEIGMVYNGTITISWSVQCGDLPKSDSPQITLSGCSELVVGEQAEITAKATDEGGSYSFWVEPEEMFSIENKGATAKLMGLSPGRGTLYVEYTSTEGKTSQTSALASCVRVQSYNNSQVLPQIALFDIDGEKLDGIKKISVTSEPKDATDLLEIIPSDPGIVTAVWLGDEIDLKALRTGITNLQATTNCGIATGPAVEVEVVNCDDETNAKLAEMMRLAKVEQKRTAEEIEKILGSKEFEKAANEIAKSTYDLAEKTALLIISTSGATGAAKTVSDILSAAASLKDFITSSNDMEKASNGLQILVAQLGSDAHQAVAGLTETISAAGKFGINLGTLLATNARLKVTVEVYEQANRQLENISGIQSICRKGTNSQPKQEQPPLETNKPKTDPTPEPVPAQKPEITKPTQPIEVPTVQEPQPEEPTANDEVIIDPERPPVPSRQMGLPYESDDCGCEKSRGLTPTSESISTMQTGFENLQKCVDNFSNGPLTEYIKTLNEWATVTEELGKAINSGPAEIESVAKVASPIIESLLVRTKSFDDAGKIFLKEFKECPESMKAGVEIFQSVEIITIESIKTNY